MTNTANPMNTEYKSHKGGYIKVGELDVEHLRNLVTKLIVDKLVPEGRTIPQEVDKKQALKALASVQAALVDIRKCDFTPSNEGVDHWKGVNKYFSSVGLLLNQYANPEKDD